MTINKSPSGITVNSAALPTNKVTIGEAQFIGGIFGDTNATRARLETDRIYTVSARIRSDGASASTPYTRFGSRTASFGYNATFELFGGRNFPDPSSLALLAQVMPGTGNQVPGTTADGTFYHLVFSSPLSPDMRPDVPGDLLAKFPNLAAQPGPGVNSPSLRDFNFSFAVGDSFSLVSTTDSDPAEVANNLTLNRLEIRSFNQIPD